MDFTIRDATVDDTVTIVEYNRLLASETESKELDRDVLAAGVRRLLSDRTLGRYFVAEAGGRVVGQVMITYEWSDWRNGMIWWLQSVYITSDWRRRGVFRGLFEHVDRLAAADPGVVGLRLYVEKENEPAQATYLRLGMIVPGYFVLEKLQRGNGASTEGAVEGAI